MKHRICRILMTDRMDMTRLLLAVSSLTWGFLLLLPVELFAPGRQTYFYMSLIATETQWGLAFLLHGVVALYTVEQRVRNIWTLTFDGLLGCLLWTTSTLACFLSHWPHQYATLAQQLAHFPPPAAMSGELWVAVASWWHLVRHWAEEHGRH